MTSTPPDHPSDGGLAQDLPRLLDRRALLALLGTTGASLALAACTRQTDAPRTPTSPLGTASPSTTSSPIAGSCAAPLPTETLGPYPGDGSNGPNVLVETGVLRSDIRSSFGRSNTTASGVPVTMTLALQDWDNQCAPLPGAAVYVWQCDANGDYSLYTGAAANENYLRGLQAAGDDGTVVFETILPGCYAGRWPHIHFEVHHSLESAIAGGAPALVSQLAFPEAACADAYSRGGYPRSADHLAQLGSIGADMVFADGASTQMLALEGDATAGYSARLAIPMVS